MKFEKVLGLVGAITIGAARAMAPVGRVAAQEVPAGLSDAIVFSACANVSPGVPLALGSGGYSFSTTATCTAPVVGALPDVCTMASDPSGTTLEAPIPCSISASGTYINAVCGTGVTGVNTAGPTLFTDSATISEGGPDPATGTIGYSIVFV